MSMQGNMEKPTREQFVAEVLRRHESGQDNAFEAYRSVYGEPNDDESDQEYVRRCAEQDYADSEHGGCVYQDVIDQWPMPAQNNVSDGYGNVQNFAAEQAGQTVKSFEIGETKFSAVRTLTPRPHWRLRVNETGEVFESGAGGISNESVPKMQADIQHLLERVSKGDTADFRRRFGLPEQSPEYQLAKQSVKDDSPSPGM